MPSAAREAPFVAELISASGRFTCALDPEGRAYCWGYNEVSQLGAATPQTCPMERQFLHAEVACSARPVAVSGELRFRFIHNGCGITPQGQAYCWGRSPRSSVSVLPRPAAPGLELQWVDVGRLSCGLTTEGQIYCWGNEIGWSTAPARLPTHLRFGALSAAHIHGCGIADDQLAYCWGFGSGELGRGHAGWGRPPSDPAVQVPVPVVGEHAFSTISTTAGHTCALALTGVAYCWGANGTGQLGTEAPLPEHCFTRSHAPFIPCTGLPTPVAGAVPFATITTGGHLFAGHTCALTAEGIAYCWGDNREGQLGLGSVSDEPQRTPQRVRTQLRFRAISAGERHTCGISLERHAYCWGDNLWGQLGDGTFEGSTVPVRVASPSGPAGR